MVAATTTACFGGGAGSSADDAAHLLQRVNEVRANAGLPALASCGTLGNAANKHATDMAVTGVHGHVGSDGSTFDQRARSAGYAPWTLLAENAAWGQTGVERVLADWLASPGHAANILNPALQHAGFARVGTNWVQMFGANGTC